MTQLTREHHRPKLRVGSAVAGPVAGTLAPIEDGRDAHRSGLGDWNRISASIALWTFVIGIAVCFPVFLWIGRNRWFVGDEFDFLAARRAGSFHDLFLPFNQHWSTLPVLAFRALWAIVGLRSYLPYLGLVIALHLTVATLLRVVMRRADIAPWVATLGALAFATFGTGYLNFEFAFQIGFCGSLVFGLCHLILADHPDRIDRRDGLGLVAGLASLMCSGVGVAMVVATAIAVALRSGLRRAAFHAGPLAAVYLVWWALIGHGAFKGPHAAIPEVARFAADDVRGTLTALGHLTGVGAVLGIVLAAGWALALLRGPVSRLRQVAAGPAALFLGAVAFLVITGFGRATAFSLRFQAPQTSRYLHVAAAMIVPALAFGADQLIRRWRLLTPVLLACLVLGIPGNMAVLVDQVDRGAGGNQIVRDYAELLPRLPAAEVVPRSLQPQPFLLPHVTMGWLVDGARTGRIPAPGHISPRAAAAGSLGLVLPPAPRNAYGPCRPVYANPFRVGTNQALSLSNRAPIVVTVSGGTPLRTLRVNSTLASGTYRAVMPVVVDLPDQSANGRSLVCEGMTGGPAH